jgi:hypothetical protein
MPFTRSWALFADSGCQSDGRLSRRDLDRRGNGTTGNNISWNEIGKPGPAATKLAFKKVCTELAAPACSSANEKLSFFLAKTGNTDACSEHGTGFVKLNLVGIALHQTYFWFIRSFGVARP